mmetsp:Transcript_35348/g.57770  ORF Transcript_35348/g.57770 Transcript_35348/m.57770 type:complete len:300 (+) Transcript_35348:1033-1932(+)
MAWTHRLRRRPDVRVLRQQPRHQPHLLPEQFRQVGIGAVRGLLGLLPIGPRVSARDGALQGHQLTLGRGLGPLRLKLLWVPLDNDLKGVAALVTVAEGLPIQPLGVDQLQRCGEHALLDGDAQVRRAHEPCESVHAAEHSGGHPPLEVVGLRALNGFEGQPQPNPPNAAADPVHCRPLFLLLLRRGRLLRPRGTIRRPFLIPFHRCLPRVLGLLPGLVGALALLAPTLGPSCGRQLLFHLLHRLLLHRRRGRDQRGPVNVLTLGKGNAGVQQDLHAIAILDDGHQHVQHPLETTLCDGL